MGNSAIMLAQTFTGPKSLTLPAQLTEKLDGVPGLFEYKNGQIVCTSRQNKPITSVPHICRFLEKFLRPGQNVMGEIYIPGMSFKDISGLVRRKEPNADTEKLRLYIWDYTIDCLDSATYYARMTMMTDALGDYLGPDDPVRVIPGHYIDTPEEFERMFNNMIRLNPTIEGVVLRALHGPESMYRAGYRSHGMLKRKLVETADLPIQSMERAEDKHGNPLDMIGRIVCEYKASPDAPTQLVGVGPGALTHEQRSDMWANYNDYIGRVIEVKYMPDTSYSALREARFFRFRPDKDTA